MPLGSEAKNGEMSQKKGVQMENIFIHFPVFCNWQADSAHYHVGAHFISTLQPPGITGGS